MIWEKLLLDDAGGGDKHHGKGDLWICLRRGEYRIEIGLVAKAADSSHSANPSATVAPVAVAPQTAVIANRGEVIAAISSAIAEKLGKDVKAIRITSIKKI